MLSAYHTRQLRDVIAIVAGIAPAEKIFLLAVETTDRYYENIFTAKEPLQQRVTHYQLLILLAAGSNRSNEAWQDMIETHCSGSTPVTARVVLSANFSQWLEAGHPFARNVMAEGLLCYDTGASLMTAPVITISTETTTKFLHDCSQYVLRSAAFLTGAALYSSRKQYKLAAFLLHQAAEQAYIAINWKLTGYRPNTHSIDRLHRFALPYSADLDAIFPRQNEKEEQLFKLLQKAYIDARYTSVYAVTETDLLDMTTRVEQLYALAQQCCIECLAVA
jgi:HEPN domain-containing protein